MKPDWPVIEVSAGDMALAMMGIKTRHVAAIKPPHTLHDRAILQCRYNGETLRYPFVIESQRAVQPKALIESPILAEYGFTHKAAKPPSNTRPTGDDATFDKDRYALRRAGEAARVLLQDHPRFTPKKHYHMRDIAGHKKWLVDIRFHPLGQLETLSAGEAKTYRNLATRLQGLLQTEILQTRSFLQNDPTMRYGGIATKLSMQRAVLLLKQLGKGDDASIEASFNATVAPLRNAIFRTTESTVKRFEQPLPDGLGQGQLLAASPSINIAIGIADRICKGHARQVVLRERPTIPEAYRDGNYCPPLAMRLAAQSKVTDRGYVAHHLDLPMQLDMMGERVINTRHLTNEQAFDLGYSNAKAMRRLLGLKPGVNIDLYLYPVAMTPANELPFDRDRTGSRINAYLDVLNDAWKQSTDPSMKDARKHDAMLPASQQREGFLRVANYREMTAEEQQPHLNNQGTRPVPNDVRAARIYAPSKEATHSDAEKPTKKPRRMKEPRKKTEGEGWVLTVAKGTSAQMAHAAAANQDDAAAKPARVSKGTALTPEERAARKQRKAALAKRDKEDIRWVKNIMRDGLDETGHATGKVR